MVLGDASDNGDGFARDKANVNFQRNAEQVLQQLTPAVVTKALEGFEYVPKIKMNELTGAIRDELKASMMLGHHSGSLVQKDFNKWGPLGGPNRKSNSETRKELLELARLAARLHEALAGRSPEAENVLWKFAAFAGDGIENGQPVQHLKFVELVNLLAKLPSFLNKAAAKLPEETKKHRAIERKAQRILHALVLSSVFERAYGRKPFPDYRSFDDGGPWADFHRRIVQLAFGDGAAANQKEVLQEAWRHYRDNGEGLNQISKSNPSRDRMDD